MGMRTSATVMSRPLKRSRIVFDEDSSTTPSLSIPLPYHSPAPVATTITCTNNNARRLMAHTVTLRPSQQRDKRRQTQNSIHTTVLRDLEREDGDVEVLVDDGIDGVLRSENDNAKRTEVPKRPVVRALPKQIAVY